MSDKKKLYLCGKKIKSIPGKTLDYSQCDITELRLTNNYIESLVNIRFPNGLKKLYLSYNRITEINGAIFPESLEELYLDNNYIRSIGNLAFLVNLRILNLSVNEITSVNNTIFPPALQVLKLFSNKITSFIETILPDTLTHIDIGSNMLNNIDRRSWPVSIRELLFENNKITYLPDNITTIEKICYTNNPFELNLINDRVQLHLRRNQFHQRSIYDDAQNVHASDVQKTILEGIKILSEELEMSMKNNPFAFSQLYKFFEKYYDKLPDIQHGYYNVSVKESVLLVLNYKHHNKSLLNEAISEGKTYCLTGQIGRIINSLSGIHPKIHIGVSQQTQANEIAIMCRNKDKTLAEFIQALKDAEIDQKIIDEISEYY
jgi:hypothetical protein